MIWTLIICLLCFVAGVVVGATAVDIFAKIDKKRILEVLKANLPKKLYLDILEEYYQQWRTKF